MSIFGAREDAQDRDRWAELRAIADLGLKNFQKTGRALHEIRERKLYRFEFTGWDQCCRQAWSISKAHADRLIAAYELCVELEPSGAVPESERQARALLTVPKEERAAAWEEALAEGATSTAIGRAVARRRGKKNAGSLKRLRVKVAGGYVIFEPNRRATGYTEMIDAARLIVTERSNAAA